METRAAELPTDAVPYPVQEEEEQVRLNKKLYTLDSTVEAAAEDERARRIQEHVVHDNESKILREINVEYAVAAMETERIRRISHQNLAQVHSEMIREQSKKEVVELMENERSRRLSVDSLAQERGLVHTEMIRGQSKKEAVELMEAERARRVSQDQLAQVHSEMFRGKSKKDALHAVETERVRRMSQNNLAELQSHLTRRKSIDSAVQLAEDERARRIKELQDQKAEDAKARTIEQSTAVSLMELERVRRMSDLPKAGSSSFLYVDKPLVEAASVSPAAAPVTPSESASVEPATSPTALPQPIPATLPELPVASSNPDEEKRFLYELQTRLKDVLPPCGPEAEAERNVSLLRFLRGHKGSVDVAAERYRTMLTLRQKHNLDQIRANLVLGNMTATDFPYYEKIKRYMPAVAAYDVRDSELNVYCFEKVGAYDVHGLLVNVSDDEWLAYSLHEMEHRALVLDRLSVEARSLVRCVVVRDLDGFSLTRVTRPALARVQGIISLASACYPETVHKTVFLNTPWIFNTFWAGVKLWLDEAQRSKIAFLRRGDQAALEAVCPLDKLPELLGRPVGVVGAHAFTGGNNAAVVVPVTGLLGKDSYGLLRENGATEAEIRARGVLQVPFRINPNDTLCWEFSVAALDVDFTIKFRTMGDGGAEEATVDGWDKTRFVHGQVEVGSWTAPQAGVAVLTWDNTFSWTRAKTICYKASVAKSADDADAIDISGHNSL
ncbi:hypothetical protein ACHHYP_09606 [Achlya hypogyna]|uniref:CRAL-TRIO domain-containing protein n=1 Tax=Achlya hypogyna TaxID=1202772 RepID=A0A1V9YMW0_ACHHY|nr:hypothetical protein ACHHYP_09606 [Achlya hypogyna]